MIRNGNIRNSPFRFLEKKKVIKINQDVATITLYTRYTEKETEEEKLSRRSTFFQARLVSWTNQPQHIYLVFGDGCIMVWIPVATSLCLVLSQISHRDVPIREPYETRVETILSSEFIGAGAWYDILIFCETNMPTSWSSSFAITTNGRYVQSSTKRAIQPPCMVPNALAMSASTLISQTTLVSNRVGSSTFRPVSTLTSRNFVATECPNLWLGESASTPVTTWSCRRHFSFALDEAFPVIDFTGDWDWNGDGINRGGAGTGVGWTGAGCAAGRAVSFFSGSGSNPGATEAGMYVSSLRFWTSVIRSFTWDWLNCRGTCSRVICLFIDIVRYKKIVKMMTSEELFSGRYIEKFRMLEWANKPNLFFP